MMKRLITVGKLATRYRGRSESDAVTHYAREGASKALCGVSSDYTCEEIGEATCKKCRARAALRTGEVE